MLLANVLLQVPQPAGASVGGPIQFQFNLLGWANGSYGNLGQLASANWMTSQFIVLHNYGWELPNVITTSETCFDPLTTTNQFVSLYSAYNYARAGQATWGFQAEDVNPGSLYPQCTRGGIATYVWANNGSSVWNSPQNHPLSAVPGGVHQRWVFCLYPTVGFVAYAACNSHTAGENNPIDYGAVHANEADTSIGTVSAAPNTPYQVFGGDFNATPTQIPWLYINWQHEADSTNTATAGASKIDYLFYRGWSQRSNGGVLNPPICIGYASTGCGLPIGYSGPYSGLGFHALSDHKLLAGFYN